MAPQDPVTGDTHVTESYSCLENRGILLLLKVQTFIHV